MFYYEYKWVVLRFPIGIGLVVLLFCVLDLWVTRDSAVTTVTSEVVQTETKETSLSPRSASLGMVWIIAILPIILLFGYGIGLSLYVLLFLKAHGQGWRLAVVLSLCTFALVYFAFVKVLGVPLPMLPMGFD